MAGTAADTEFMTAALSLAARGLGDTWPNPAVGCVIVKDGVIIGRGWTQSGGRPHAESEALKRAGAAAKGATAYVTLEPCTFRTDPKKNAPCSDSLIAAGVRRVVVAAYDPDARMSGAGFDRLRDAGIEVDQGICRPEANRLNAGYFLRLAHKRPLFCLKTATTLDGRISFAPGEQSWITGFSARQAAHALRARYDAILVGSGTVIADDPLLTCRVEGYTGRPKVRVVLDRSGRVPAISQVAQTAKEIPTWVMPSDSVLDAATELAGRGITRVLIEGGSKVATAFLQAGLVDELAWFRNPSIIGAGGTPAVDAIGQGEDVLQRFSLAERLVFGPDTLDILRKAG